LEHAEATAITLVFPETNQHPRIETIEKQPAYKWVKPAPEPLVNLSGKEINPSALVTGPIRSPGWQLDRFSDVHLVWSHFLLLDNEVHKPYFLNPRQSMDWYAGYKSIAAMIGVEQQDGEYRLDARKLREAIHIEGSVLFASAEEPQNWGAMLLYTVPAAVHFVKNRPTYSKFFAHICHPNMLDLLRLIGLQDDEIIDHDFRNRSYHFDDLYLFRKEYRDMFFGSFERLAYDEVRASALARSTRPAAAKVFISRLQLTRAGGKRGLTNEIELSEQLVNLGFSVVEPDQLAVEEQIATFGNAEQIIGLGGAGLFGTVFCRPGIRLLDIESSTTFLQAHSNLFASCQLRYGLALGVGDPNDARGEHRRWSLDLDRALPAIAACFDGNTAG
jgi:hypothetical protein